MKSKANIKGHPLHAVLVPFPLAFFTGAFILDVLLISTKNQSYGQAAMYVEIGGIIFGLIAAIPGIIDFIYTVPPESSANKRALKHGLLNISNVMIFLFALLLRLKDMNLILITAIEGIGVILLTVAGYLGGTLVVRNQIGVDHRYADAGKWKEEYITSTSNKIEIKEPDKLKTNQMKLIHVNGKRIVIARTETAVIAFDDRCTHRGGSLADGVMICETVQCPWHGSQFDTKSGNVKAGPATEKIKIYNVTAENGKTFLLL